MAADQDVVLLGVQSRFYDAAATADFLYEAEALTPLGTSTKVVGAAGASGSGSNVVRNSDLIPTYQAILKSEIDATNLALTHVDSFRIWARAYRPTSNTGAVSVRLEWGQGDLRRRTLNDPIVFAAGDWEGQWTLIDLGTVHLTAPEQGAHRWEFRPLAKSTVTGDEIDFDYFLLFPTTEGYGEASRLSRLEEPTSFSARDEFDQTAGNLTAKTLPVGGTWSGAGDAGDFTVETGGKTAQRAEALDADLNTGRYVTASTPTLTGTYVQADIKQSAVPGGDLARFGVLARFTDTSNWLMAVVCFSPSRLDLIKRVSGTVTVIDTLAGSEFPFPWTVTNWHRLKLFVNGRGEVKLWFDQVGSSEQLLIETWDAVLAGGGALASGKVGLVDAYTGGAGPVRNYDNFAAWAETPDAAVFAGQSLEWSHDGVLREDSSGTFWQRVSSYRGRYLKIPPAGREGRSVRVMVKTVRGPVLQPGVILDPAIDDSQAQLFYTPRGLVAPES